MHLLHCMFLQAAVKIHQETLEEQQKRKKEEAKVITVITGSG